jgi:hypothetical protein
MITKFDKSLLCVLKKFYKLLKSVSKLLHSLIANFFIIFVIYCFSEKLILFLTSEKDC